MQNVQQIIDWIIITLKVFSSINFVNFNLKFGLV